jgi:hypothetical protein
MVYFEPSQCTRSKSHPVRSERSAGSPLEHGLADEVVLLVNPVLLGKGKGLFAEGAPPRAVALESTHALPPSIVINTFQGRWTFAGPEMGSGRQFGNYPFLLAECQLVACLAQTLNYARQLHDLNLSRAVVPIVTPTNNHVTTGGRMSVIAEIPALEFKFDAHSLPAIQTDLSLGLTVGESSLYRFHHVA